MEIKENSFIDLDFVNRLVAKGLPITNREKEVLTHLAKGNTNKGISKVLRLSPSTVRNHISNIFLKLKISNRSQATVIAIYAGLLDNLNPNNGKNDVQEGITYQIIE